MINIKFKVKETHTGKFQIIGTKGYKIILDNRHDALKHCDYLNQKEDEIDLFRQENIEYYTVLTKIKMLAEQIQQESGEIHILELAIRIKKLIREALP